MKKVGGKTVPPERSHLTPDAILARLPLQGPDFLRQYLERKGEKPPAPATDALVWSWFDDALDRSAPRPSQDACAQLASKINRLMETPGGGRPIIAEERARRLMALWDAARNFRAALAHYVPYGAPGPENNTSRAFMMVDQVLEGVGVSDMRPEPSAPVRGRPEAHWHACGHYLADDISAAARQAGYRRTLNKKDDKSVTAIVGAAIIRHFFQNEIDASGFAVAMKRRHRMKKTTSPLDDPNFSRLKQIAD